MSVSSERFRLPTNLRSDTTVLPRTLILQVLDGRFQRPILRLRLIQRIL